MDPISIIGVVGSVIGVADIIARSLKGLVSLKAVYRSAELLVTIVIGHLHTVEAILGEIREWLKTLNGDSGYVDLLWKIDMAVTCCAVIAEALSEKVDSLQRGASKGLTAKGKLLYLLGENEIKEMNAHLGTQVQALHILVDAARSKTPAERQDILENVGTLSILQQLQVDSSSYRRARSKTMSVLTRRSASSGYTQLLDSDFEFDSVVLNSQVYRHAFRIMLQRQHFPGPKPDVTESGDSASTMTARPVEKLKSFPEEAQIIHLAQETGVTLRPSQDTVRITRQILPAADIADLIRSVFMANLSEVNLTQALAALEDMKDLNSCKNIEVAAVLQRLGPDVNPQHQTWKRLGPVQQVVADWITGIIAESREIDKLYLKTDMDLRRFGVADGGPTELTRYNFPVGAERQGKRKDNPDGWLNVLDVIENYLRRVVDLIERCLAVSGRTDIKVRAVENFEGVEHSASRQRHFITAAPQDKAQTASNMEESSSADLTRAPQSRALNAFLKLVPNPIEHFAQRAARARHGKTKSQSTADPAAAKGRAKVLILGASESGKSTLLKQFKIILDTTYSDVERKEFKDIIRTDMVMSMRVVLEAMEALELRFPGSPLEELPHTVEGHVQTIFQQTPLMDFDKGIPVEVTEAIVALRNDKGVQECMERSHEYQLNDAAAFYFANAERIGDPRYLPTDVDIVRSRVKTVDITETTFNKGEHEFSLFDIGGARGQRRKWIHAFENVDSILFTVDIANYDQSLFEDETVNRMQEQLELFDSIVNFGSFIHTNFTLLFTKTDTLREKLDKSPLASYCPDYAGSTYEDAKTYFEGRFLSLDNRKVRQIDTHFVNLIDMEDACSVVRTVVDTALYQARKS